jgi:RNA polymerase sigma factor (sigma-70 family)
VGTKLKKSDEKTEAQIIKYISKVVSNASKNYFRKKYQLSKREIQYGRHFDELKIDQNNYIKDEFYNKDFSDFNKYENFEIISDLFDFLTEKEKFILFSKFFLNKTDTEIANELGITRQGVTNFKIRLYKKAKQILSFK